MAEEEKKTKRMAAWQLGLLQGVIFTVLVYVFGGDSKASAGEALAKAGLAGLVFGAGMTWYETHRRRKEDGK